MALSKKSKGILTIIGTILNVFGVGATESISSFGVYLASYYNSIDKKVGLNYSFLISSVGTIGASLMVPVGGMVEQFLGPRFNLIIGLLVKYWVMIAIYQSKSVFTAYLYVFILGLARGFGAVLPKHACFYFPDKKGLLTGIIALATITTIAATNLAGELLINPRKEQVLIDSECYAPEVGQNFEFYIRCVLYFFPVCELIAIAIVQPFDLKTKVEENNVVEEVQMPDEPILKGIENDDNETAAPTAKETTEKENVRINKETEENTPRTSSPVVGRSKVTYKKDIYKALKSKRLWVLIGVCFFSNFFPLLANNTYKPIGGINQYTQKLIVIISTLTGVVSFFAAPIWGYLADKLKFKDVMTILNLGLVISGAIMCFFMTFQYVFSIAHIVQVVLWVGLKLSIIPYIMKIFSIQYSLEIGGVVDLAVSSSDVIGSVISFLITIFIKPQEGLWKNLPYLTFYILGIILNGLAILLVRKAKDDQFDYDQSSIMDISPIKDDGNEDALQ